MGTDMFAYAELRDGDVWKAVPEPTPQTTPDPYSNYKGPLPVEALDVGRAYSLFAVLCGNPISLVAKNDEIPAIAKARGFPKDMNACYSKCFRDEYDPEGGDHGFSWLSLAEIIDFDWNHKVTRSAWVDTKFAPLFTPGGSFPQDFPKDAKRYHGLFHDPPEGTQKVTWSMTVADYVGRGHEYLIQELSRFGDKENVRMIFWFNS